MLRQAQHDNGFRFVKIESKDYQKFHPFKVVTLSLSKGVWPIRNTKLPNTFEQFNKNRQIVTPN
jgi:hypothetical protein